MKRLGLFVLLIAGIVFAAGEGRQNIGGETQEQALRSMADLYTMKLVNISAESGDIVVATKWPNYIVKGFYNPTRGSSLYVKCRTQQLDTVTISIPAESWTPKLPPMDIIFKTGTNDSVMYLFQRN